ncbi:MAG: hypothetical protein ACRYG5_02385 [Janthinobacterium lividum]
MNRLFFAAVAALAAGGCASYSVKPFFDKDAGKVICCEATATNSKSIATVNFTAIQQPNGTFVVRFAETGVSASAPIAAAAIAASDVAGAVTETVITASKLLP